MATQNVMRSFFNWDEQSGITKAGAGKFPNPFCDIASEYVPKDLNTIFEWCTPAGTQVALDVYGRTAAIETIKIGDTVLAASGKILPVTDVMQHEVDEPLADLKVAGLFRRLRITRNHKLHIWRPGVDAPAYRLPWHLAESAITGIPAGNVKVGDWVCFPRAEYEIKGDWPYSMYICGMYLSEGCLIQRRLSDGQEHRRGVRFTLGSHERTLIDRLAQELTEYTGMRPVIRVSDDRPDVCTVTIFDPELADWLANNFGEYAWGKRIPDSVFHLPVSMRLEFIAAWLDGDGHVFRSRGHVKSVHGCSCCRDLIVQMCRLSESCGMYPNYHEKENTRFGSDVKEGSWLYRLDYYLADAAIVGPHMLKLAPGETVNGKARKDNVKATDHYVWRRVEDVGTVPFTGTVYNITVEGEHTYTVEGCAVFNCEYLMLSVTPFRAVSQRVVRYFLTELVLEGQSDNEREKYEDFLNNQLHVIQQMAEIGDDFMTYGNAFVSIYFPFDRFLICPHCHTSYHISTIAYKFNRTSGTFTCDCPKCKTQAAEMRREDRRSPDTSRVKIIRWSPKDMRLRVHPISGKIEYYLRLDSTFVSKLLEGEPFYLNETPWQMIEACLKSDKSKKEYLFKFKDDSIYHMRCSTLAGLPVKGWAIPPILPNFKLAYYVQLLRRYDEAIALDFIVPFRILYPSNTSPQGQDVLSSMNMSSFIGHMQNMINNKRKNLTDIAVVPFSIGYEALGGEARTLAPKDNIALAVDELLNSLGYPAEMYKGTLSIQAFPVALRLFEKQWNSLVDGFNDFSAWLCKRLSRHFMWGEVDCSLRSVTLADDIERKALSLQAAAGQDVSKQTAYRPLGIDYMEEQKRIVEEQEAIQKLQQEAMERAQAQQAAPAAQGGGGAPAAGATPGDVYEQAKALAQQLLLQTPETMRRGELIKIKHSNPTLHALVLQQMDEMRQDMARQGQAMMMEQAKQAEAIGYGAAASLPSPIRVQLMIADQLTDYNRGDLRKIAMDVRDKIPHADDAFRFVYRRMMGWE